MLLRVYRGQKEASLYPVIFAIGAVAVALQDLKICAALSSYSEGIFTRNYSLVTRGFNSLFLKYGAKVQHRVFVFAKGIES